LIKRNSAPNSEPTSDNERTKKVTLKELMDTRGLSISRLIKKRALDIRSGSMAPALQWKTRAGKRFRSNFASAWKTRVGKKKRGGCKIQYPEMSKTRLARREDIEKPNFTTLWKTRLGKRGSNCDDEDDEVDRTPDLTDFHSTRELWKTRLYKRSQKDTLNPDFAALWKTRLGKKRQNARLPGFSALWKTRLG